MSGIGNALGGAYGWGKNQLVDLMGGGKPKAPLPYDQAILESQQQQQLADMLRKQAAEDIPIQSYKGIQAPIPWTAVLAKALTGINASSSAAQANKVRADATAQAKSDADRLAEMLTKGKKGIISPTTTLDATTPQLPGAPAPAQTSVQLPTPDMQGNTNPTYGYTPLSDDEKMAAVLAAGNDPYSGFIKNMYAPDLLAQKRELEKRSYDERRAAIRPTTADEKAKFGIDLKTPAYTDANGGVHPITDPNQLTAEQKASLANQDRAFGLQMAQFQLAKQQANRPIAYGANEVLLDPNTRQIIGKTPPTIKEQQEMVDRANSQKNAVASSDTAIDSLDKLMKNKSGFESAVGFPDNPVSGLPWIGGFAGTDRKNFEAQLETLKAQTFLPMVANLKGMGALSDAEGKKLNAAVGALDPGMSEEAFKASATDIWMHLVEARNRLPGAGAMPKQFARQPWMVKRTGTDKSTGKKVVEYYDGVVENAP